MKIIYYYPQKTTKNIFSTFFEIKLSSALIYFTFSINTVTVCCESSGTYFVPRASNDPFFPIVYYIT